MLAVEAEATGNLTLLAQSNSLRKSAKDKRETAGRLDRQIDEQLLLIKTQ
jgi:hypothetical protein